MIPNKTFADLLLEYRGKVSVKKRGTRWETIQIDSVDNADQLGWGKLGYVNQPHFAQCRG